MRDKSSVGPHDIELVNSETIIIIVIVIDANMCESFVCGNIFCVIIR